MNNNTNTNSGKNGRTEVSTKAAFLRLPGIPDDLKVVSGVALGKYGRHITVGDSRQSVIAYVELMNAAADKVAKKQKAIEGFQDNPGVASLMQADIDNAQKELNDVVETLAGFFEDSIAAVQILTPINDKGYDIWGKVKIDIADKNPEFTAAPNRTLMMLATDYPKVFGMPTDHFAYNLLGEVRGEQGMGKFIRLFLHRDEITVLAMSGADSHATLRGHYQFHGVEMVEGRREKGAPIAFAAFSVTAAGDDISAKVKHFPVHPADVVTLNASAPEPRVRDHKVSGKGMVSLGEALTAAKIKVSDDDDKDKKSEKAPEKAKVVAKPSRAEKAAAKAKKAPKGKKTDKSESETAPVVAVELVVDGKEKANENAAAVNK